MNDDYLYEIYPQYSIERLREDRNKWYNKAQSLHESLKKQDKVIDQQRLLIKEMEQEISFLRKSLELRHK